MNLVKIKDFPNYSINEEGEIYSNHSGKLRLITPYKNQDGYLMVRLYSNKKRDCSVHCLVAETFIGPPPEGLVVHHIDGDKTNNKKQNLRYITHKENINIFWRDEASEEHIENNKAHCINLAKKRRVFNATDILTIKQLRSTGMTMAAIAAMFKVDYKAINRILNNESYKELG